MPFPQNVERWRSVVQTELSSVNVPLPTELILSVIKKESGGNPNAISNKGAMGLTQVMPNTLSWYNDTKGTNYTESQFKSSPQLQIKIGIWVLKTFWKSAYRYLKDRTNQMGVDLLSKAASLFYVFGPGRAREYWDKTDPTYEAFAAKFANTDPIRNGYATKIWDWANEAGAQWSPEAINRWLGGNIDNGTDTDTNNNTVTDDTLSGALLAVIIMAAAWLLFKGKK